MIALILQSQVLQKTPARAVETVLSRADSSAGPGTGGTERDRQGALTAGCTGRMRPRETGGREELVLCKGAPGALVVFLLGA